MAAGGKVQLMEASMHVFARRALAVVLLMIASMAAWAQGYPDRPLRLVVGFPPGGSGDFLARIIADELTREIGQPVVVDNRPGAGSNIAAEHVARAAPDGYTILLAGNFTHAINPWLSNLSWDPHRDFTPITEVAVMSIIVCVTPQRGIGRGRRWGIRARPRLRPEVKQRLYAAITRVMRLPQVAEKLGREAMEPEVSASPEDFAAFVRRDHASYEPIVKASGAKAD